MSTDKVTVILLAVLACAWIGDFVRGIFQRRKIKAEAALSDANADKIVVGTAVTLLAPLRQRVGELEAEVKEARAEVQKLVRQLHAATLENQRVTNENQRITGENQEITQENQQLRAAIARGGR